MLIREFRVTLPMTVEEYQVAQLFCVAEASKDNTGGGEGIEVLKNEPFENFPLLDGMYSKGQYTHKIYHIASRVPSFIRMLLPKGSMEIHEEAWNAYPYCRTILTNPHYMKENFRLCIETLHVDDAGQSENVHKLAKDKLDKRGVVHIDIANDEVSTAHYKKEEDPKLFKSEKTGRGPLNGKWQDGCKPIMTCYKLVTVEFKWFGLQNRVESLIQKTEQQLFLNFHRQVFCSMDKWHGLTMADIRAIEEKTKLELDKARNEGEVRGLKGAVE